MAIAAPRLSRRTWLKWAALAPALLLARTPPARAAARVDQLEAFLALSRRFTGFEQLDPQLGARYLTALLSWDPGLSALLTLPGSSAQFSASQLATVDLVIETWYTGTVPSGRGTEVVTYQHALGGLCLPRQTPVTYCRQP